MVDTQVHFGIIGTGGICNGLHLPAMRDIPEAVLLTTADIRLGRVQYTAALGY